MLLDDSSNAVRIATAELLIRHGSADERQKAMQTLLDCADMTQTGIWDAVLALGTLDSLALDDALFSDVLGKLPRQSAAVPEKFSRYVGRLLEHMGLEN